MSNVKLHIQQVMLYKNVYQYAVIVIQQGAFTAYSIAVYMPNCVKYLLGIVLVYSS